MFVVQPGIKSGSPTFMTSALNTEQPNLNISKASLPSRFIKKMFINIEEFIMFMFAIILIF